MVAFVARTPLKVVLVDRWRDRWLDRTRLAARIATVEIVVLALLVAFAVVEGESGFWVPLAFAAPLVALELWYDMRSRGRRLVPELAGAIGIGSIATAIALADGASTRLAWGLWVVVAARSLAAIPYVRFQIQRTKSQAGPRWHSDLSQVVAVTAAAIAWLVDLVPLAAAIAIAVVAVINVAAVRLAPVGLSSSVSSRRSSASQSLPPPPPQYSSPEQHPLARESDTEMSVTDPNITLADWSRPDPNLPPSSTASALTIAAAANDPSLRP